MARRFSNILETIGNTPVVRINRLAPAGVNLYVKVEAFNPLGSVKDRLAIGVIEAAEKSGQLKPGQPNPTATPHIAKLSLTTEQLQNIEQLPEPDRKAALAQGFCPVTEAA